VTREVCTLKDDGTELQFSIYTSGCLKTVCWWGSVNIYINDQASRGLGMFYILFVEQSMLW